MGRDRIKRAEGLARAGYMSGAVRALSDGAVCNTSDPEVYNKLRELQSAESQPDSSDVISQEEFIPDAAGWRGEYFKYLSPNAKEYLFKLAQHILQNPKSLPAELRPYLFGARLIVLPKPQGGVRPIAIGTILRKDISETLVRILAPQLPEFFAPLQFGVGVPGGTENVVQGLRLAKALSEDNVVAEVDFTNAFNSVERSVIEDLVIRRFPMLKTWFQLCYGKPSHLLVKDQKPIRSERGVQQGDPLGPFLFALALQPALVKAAEVEGCCVMAYLDDVYVCGKPNAVAEAIEKLLLAPFSDPQDFFKSIHRTKCFNDRTYFFLRLDAAHHMRRSYDDTQLIKV